MRSSPISQNSKCQSLRAQRCNGKSQARPCQTHCMGNPTKKHPPNLKLSLLAAVPHKSCEYQAILDLSFQLWLGGILLPSVNATTIPHANEQAMKQLGHVLPWIITTIATLAPENGPIFFAKLDIKDGFWQLVMHETDAWNFCYILLAKLNEPIYIVVPTSLQMGWCESPALFCMASKTT